VNLEIPPFIFIKGNRLTVVIALNHFAEVLPAELNRFMTEHSPGRKSQDMDFSQNFALRPVIRFWILKILMTIFHTIKLWGFPKAISLIPKSHHHG